MRRKALLLGFLLAAFAGYAGAVTFVVSNTNDSGLGSLRSAIILANASPGADIIEFALPASAPVIQLQTPLPTITNAVTIGATRIAEIEISGFQLPAGSRGLHVTAHDAWLEGMAINGFAADLGGNGGDGIVLEGGSGSVVTLCAIGTDRARTTSVPNGGSGIRIVDSSFNFIENNLIVGNRGDGIRIQGNSDSNQIYANRIGPPAVTGPGPNLGYGVAILSGDDNLMGTDGVCTICVSNVVIDNGGGGVFIGAGAVGTRIDSHNFIGSISPIPGNQGHGVEIQGGQSSVITATIAGNLANGVFVGSGSGNSVRGSVFQNGGLGIDLAPGGINPNDVGDGDAGPNGLQNFPILSSVVTSPDMVVTLTGTLQSASNSPYILDFYSSPSCDDFGNGEGENFIGSTNVVTDAAGNAPFNVVFDPLLLSGNAITATATDAIGSTSEFSPCILADIPVVTAIQPDSGPDTGGTHVDILGQNFDPAATVTIGGAVPANVVVTSATEIDADTPALPPGTLNDIRVTNPDGQMGILGEGWFSNFLDVPESHIFHDFVEVIFREHVTAGCGFGLYCVDQAVPREQMAVFLLRSRYGPGYTPPPATGTVFPNDVPADGFAADYIEALHALGITAGCDVGSFCPTDPVTRAQMSVFLLRTLEGPTYNPPPATGTTFTDVPLGSFAAAWIEELFERGITAGCDVTLFCPNDSTTRGQMAVFLTVTFGL